MKILSDGRIQVESGDTLSGIYGSNWKTLSGYIGDPTKLQIGTILPSKSPAQLVANPQLATDTNALAQYKGISNVASATPQYQTYNPITGQTTYGQPPTTQTTGILTSETPKVGTSQIDAGKTAIQTLTDLGVSTDVSTIKGNWARNV